MVGTIARPSRPSVRLTAFEAPIMTSMANGKNSSPSGTRRSLKNGSASPVASGSWVSAAIQPAAISATSAWPSSLVRLRSPPLERRVTLR